MLLSVPQSARRAYSKRLSENGISIQLLFLLLCFQIVPYTAQEAHSGEFKAVFKRPCGGTMTLQTAVEDLTEFTVCTYLRLDTSSRWTAFTYKSDSGTELELSGNDKVIDIWIFNTWKNVKQNLNNKNKWYEICILWNRQQKLMTFYLNGKAEESFDLKGENLLPGRGSLSLGCPPTNEEPTASEDLLELYMFRMWNSANNALVKSCKDGNVIQWNLSKWNYNSNETIKNDSSLNCESMAASLTPSPLTTPATTSKTTVTTLTPSTTSAKTAAASISPPASAPSETFFTTATTSAKTAAASISPPTSATTSTTTLPTLTTLTPSTTSESMAASLTPSPLTTPATTSTTTVTTLTPSTTSAKTAAASISLPASAPSETFFTTATTSAKTILTPLTTSAMSETFFTTATTSAKPQTSLISSPTSAKTILTPLTTSAPSETFFTMATTSAKTSTPLISSPTSGKTILTPLTTSALKHAPDRFKRAFQDGTATTGNGTTLLSLTERISSASINNTAINVTTNLIDSSSDVTSFQSTTFEISRTTDGNECQLNDSLNANICKNFTHCNYSDIYEFTLNEDENVCKSLENKFMDEPEANTSADSTFSPMTSLTDGNLEPTTNFTETQNTSDITNASTVPTTSPSVSFSIKTTMNSMEPEATSTNSTESIFTTISMEPTSNISSENKTCTFMVGAKLNEKKCDVISKIKSENKNYTISKIRKIEFCCCFFKENCPPNITAFNSSNCNFSETSLSCGSGGSGGSGGNDQITTTTTKATTSLTTATTKATTSLTAATTKATTSLTTATTKATMSLATTAAKATTSTTTKTTKITTSTPSQTTSFNGVLDRLNNTLSSVNVTEDEVNNAVAAVEDLLTGDVSSDEATGMVKLIDTFLNLPQEQIDPVANRLKKIVDSIGLKLVFNGSSINITSNSLAVAVKKINATSFSETSFGVTSSGGLQVSLGSHESTNSTGTIVLPASLLNGLANASRIQFNFYNNTKFFRNASLSNTNLTLVSKVISASVGNLSITNLMNNVTVILKANGEVNKTMHCAFWNFALNETGDWDLNGCSVVSNTDNETVCTCNHLTSFSILLDVSGATLPGEHLLRLTFISYIGCGLSAIFLSITMVTYIAFEKLRRDYPSKILIQLCAALIGLNLSFLLSPWIAVFKEIPGLCIAAAAFMHYFVLVSITWMGLEAFHMYLSLVKVFNTYVRKYMLKFCIIGWGCPAIVVAIVLAVDRTLYKLLRRGTFPDGTEDKFCWIEGTLFYVTVVGYYVLIFLLNVSMFIVVLIQLCRIKKQKQIGYQRKTTFQDLRSVAGITFLLGITWGLGFFSWGPGHVEISYIFAILNSLQGFFIFLFYCLAKENVRKQWRRYLCCGKLRLAENSDWSKTTTNKLKKQSSKQGASSNSSNSIQSNTNSNSTSLLVSNEYFTPNGNGNVFKERNGSSIMGPNGNVPFYDLSVVHFYKNGNTQTASIRRTSNKAGVHFMEQT